MRVGVLGPLEVYEGARRIPIASARQRALLAMLALDPGHVLAADRLIEGIWGEALPGDALNALRHHVSRLRKLIGPSLVAQGSGYILAVGREDVDALRFAQLASAVRSTAPYSGNREGAAALREALALWRGAPLEEFLDHDWARREASRLTELRLSVLEDCLELELSSGLHAEVVEEIRGVVEEHPFRERLWGQLMLALYRCGRQAEALAAYEQARRVLAEELGLDPGPELAGLETAILTQDAALAVPLASAQPSAGTPTELPTPLTRFIGRQEQLSAVRRKLEESRLLTLTGPPGVGKTRLALEAGRLLQREFPDGVWLVELAPLADAGALPGALATVLGLPPDASVGDYLRRRHGLVILDNCEHLVAGVARLVEPLLASCPRLRVLATSREVLGVAGEAQWPVPALTLPALDVDDPRELAGSEAVRLFEDRAAKVRPSFALTSETAPSVAEVCRRLDGLPLAIELAAARVKVVPVSHIVEALDDRFRLLVGGSRTAPARQQTLRAAADWSYDLLHADERRLFERLSLFPAGCSLEAAEWIGEELGLDSFELLDVVAGLADKSLLVATVGADGQPRYRMLETLRAYGIERSHEQGTADGARRRHGELFATIAEAGERGLCGPDHFRWRRRLNEDFDNFRAALRAALADGDAAVAVRIAGALGFFFSSSDRHGEGRAWLEAALGAADDTVPAVTRARALTYLGSLESQLGDLDQGIEDAELGLATAQAAGDPWQTALSTALLAFTLDAAQRPDRVPGLLAQARTGYDRVGEPRADWGVAGCELVAALRAVRSGDLDGVERANHELRARAERLRDPVFTTWSKLLAGWVAERRGQLQTAADQYSAAVEVTRPLGASPYVAFMLALMGRVATRRGELGRARTLHREAAAMANAAASPWFAAFVHYSLAATLWRLGDVEGGAALARQALDEASAVGERFSREALFFALGGSPAARSSIVLGGLARSRGDVAEAARRHCAALERAGQEFDREAIALAFEGLAAAAAEPDRAATLLGAADSVRDSSSVPRDPFEAREAERIVEAAAIALGHQTVERLLAEGRRLSLEEAVTLARSAYA